MTATKDQRKLLNRCVMNEIPVFVLTGTDRCAMAAGMLGRICGRLGTERASGLPGFSGTGAGKSEIAGLTMIF